MKKQLFSLLAIFLVSTSLFGCGKEDTQQPVEDDKNEVLVDDKDDAEDILEDTQDDVEVETPESNDTSEFKELAEYVMMPLPIDEVMAQEIYHIDPTVVDEYTIYDTGRSPGVGTIVILEAQDGKIDDAKAIIDQILADKVGKAFYPDEVDAANAAITRVDGDYAALFIVFEEYREPALAKYEELIK